MRSSDPLLYFWLLVQHCPLVVNLHNFTQDRKSENVYQNYAMCNKVCLLYIKTKNILAAQLDSLHGKPVNYIAAITFYVWKITSRYYTVSTWNMSEQHLISSKRIFFFFLYFHASLSRLYPHPGSNSRGSTDATQVHHRRNVHNHCRRGGVGVKQREDVFKGVT